jgi:peptidyl-prolyl cis-trans isomerase C
MKSQFAVALAAVACLGLGSCGDGGQPKGQVVAKVGKSEITVLDLQSELNGFKAPDAATRKIAERQALNSIVQRKILANAARKLKIDKTPEYAREQEKMNDSLLVRSWQARLVKAVPTPTPEDAQQFVNEHPDIYAARKIYSVEAIRFPRPNDPTLAKALQPLDTLDQVRAVLTDRKIPFSNGNVQIDAFATDPRIVEQLTKLKPNDIFILPQGNVVLVGHVTGAKIDAVANNQALKQATEYLRQRRAQEAVTRQFASAIGAAKKDVKFSKGYELPTPTPPTAPGAATGAPAPQSPAKPS